MTTALAVVALGIAWRLWIGPALAIPQAVPLTALALYAAMWLPRRWAILTAMAMLVGSNLILDASHGYPDFMVSRFSMYLAVLMIVWLGRAVPARSGLGLRAGAAAAGCTLYFLVTNFLVWVSREGFSYPLTWGGLLSTFSVAIPFYRNMLVTDLIVTAGLFALDRVWLARHEPAETAANVAGNTLAG